MLSHYLPSGGHDDQQPPVIGAQADLLTDEPGGHRVAGRAEPHARQPVDLAHHQPANAGPQRRQRRQQLPLDDQPLSRHRADLAVHHAVDLSTPRRRCPVRRRQLTQRRLRHHQIAFGIADQVLHDPLRLRVGGLAEVGAEPVVRGEPHILRRGHHHVGDDGTFQAAHPVRQHLARHPAQRLEAFRQQRQRRRGPLIGSEPHKPEPRPGQHRAEHVPPALGAPVDHQILTRRPHAGRRPR